jgi:hypothetical protein
VLSPGSAGIRPGSPAGFFPPLALQVREGGWHQESMHDWVPSEPAVMHDSLATSCLPWRAVMVKLHIENFTGSSSRQGPCQVSDAHFQLGLTAGLHDLACAMQGGTPAFLLPMLTFNALMETWAEAGTVAGLEEQQQLSSSGQPGLSVADAHGHVLQLQQQFLRSLPADQGSVSLLGRSQLVNLAAEGAEGTQSHTLVFKCASPAEVRESLLLLVLISCEMSITGGHPWQEVTCHAPPRLPHYDDCVCTLACLCRVCRQQQLCAHLQSAA